MFDFGFEMEEVMQGTHEFLSGRGPSGKFPFVFKVRWGTDNIKEWINPTGDKFLVNKMHGTLSAGGLGDNIPIEGTLTLKYFTEYKIVYEFTFELKGHKYYFVGEKVNIKPWNLQTSHTTCFGTLISDDVKIASRSITYFKLSTAFDFIKSFKII